MKRTPRSRYYDGIIYDGVLGVFMQGLHAVIAKQVEPGQVVLDAGCGTGRLALLMAKQAAQVVGVDLSPRMVARAQQKVTDGPSHVSFVLGDVAQAMGDVPDGHFDLATLVLSLHEMPGEAGVPVLAELARLAKQVICVDFRVPMPRNLAGARNRLFELAAGPEHFAAFRRFNARGGVPGVCEAAGLQREQVRSLDSGTLEMHRITR